MIELRQEERGAGPAAVIECAGHADAENVVRCVDMAVRLGHTRVVVVLRGRDGVLGKRLAARIPEGAAGERHPDERAVDVAIEVIGRAARRHLEAAHVRAHHHLVLVLPLGDDVVAVRADLPHDLGE